MVRVAAFRLRRRIVCKHTNNAEADGQRTANLLEMRQPKNADDRTIAFHAVRVVAADCVRPLSGVRVHVRRAAGETRRTTASPRLTVPAPQR